MKKEETRTPLPSRRRRALRYLSRAILAVLLVNYVLHVGYLLPIQAVRAMEEREGVHGRIVTRLWEPDISPAFLLYMTENQDMVLLGSTYLHFLGWSPGFGLALDCTGGAPLVAGEQSAAKGEEGSTVWHFYGRVDDPEIETVEISLRYIAGYNRGRGENIYREHARLTASREDWLEKEGRRFFLLRWDQPEDWPEDKWVNAFAIGRNAEGEIVTEFDIEDFIHSFYG